MESIWTASYQNNQIRVENTWFNGERLFVNGVLQDERMGLFSTNLTGHLINEKGERENIKVNLSGWFKITCRLFINDARIEAHQEK